MEQLIITDGGVQYVPQLAAEQQIVYLDFDGEATTYRNKDLDITLDVEVEDSGMSEEQKRYILAELSEKYANQNIVFTIEKPEEDQEHSTIFIGQTDDFDEYGFFAGVAETIDKGNQIKNDNAFVFADYTSDPDSVISVVAHELGHIVEGVEHDITVGGLEDYTRALDDAYWPEFSYSDYQTVLSGEYKQFNLNINIGDSVSIYLDLRGGTNSFVYLSATCEGFAKVTGYKFKVTFTKNWFVIKRESTYIYSFYDMGENRWTPQPEDGALFETPRDYKGQYYDPGIAIGITVDGGSLVGMKYAIIPPDAAPPVIYSFSANASYETATVSINAQDASSTITRYYVSYCYIDTNNILHNFSKQSNSPYIVLYDLLPGTTYMYHVAAEDEYGNKSKYSSNQTFTTLTDTVAPVFTGNITYASTGNNITLTWNAATDNASVANYEVVFNGTIYNTGVNRTLTLNNITPGTYTYSVAALDKTGNRSVARTGTTQTYTVTNNITGSGSLTGAGTYFSGTPITVTATPDVHQLFVSLSVNGQYIEGNTANITVNKATQVSAVFRPMEQYAVTVKSNFNDLTSLLTVSGSDKNEGNNRYYETSSVTFTAGNKKGYTFDYWLVNGQIYNEQTLTLNNISADLNAEAVYSIYDINFDITKRTHEDDFIIKNLSSVAGEPTYSITLGSGYTKPGVYKLISGAAGFNETIRVFAGSNLLGTLSPNGDAIVTQGVVSRYLTLENGDLLLTIKDNLYVYKNESVYNHVISGPYYGIVSGSLTGVSVVSGGQLFVSGRVNDATVSSGTLYVYSGGSVSKTKVNTANLL